MIENDRKDGYVTPVQDSDMNRSFLADWLLWEGETARGNSPYQTGLWRAAHQGHGIMGAPGGGEGMKGKFKMYMNKRCIPHSFTKCNKFLFLLQISNMKVEREKALEHKKRMSRMMEDKENFLSKITAARSFIYEVRALRGCTQTSPGSDMAEVSHLSLCFWRKNWKHLRSVWSRSGRSVWRTERSSAKRTDGTPSTGRKRRRSSASMRSSWRKVRYYEQSGKPYMYTITIIFKGSLGRSRQFSRPQSLEICVNVLENSFSQLYFTVTVKDS